MSLLPAITPTPMTEAEAEAAFGVLLDGGPSEEDIAGFLVALSERGETADEIAGAARALRARLLPIHAPEGAIDVCGTGGDGHHTLNVSTAVSLVVAACGVPVAKHGNRAASSKSGAADVLTALGVKVGIDPAGVARCIREAGVGFMFAPAHHASMRHVGPVRVEMGTRTIFNLLGPLSNPAGAKRQMIGVFAESWLEPLAQVLKSLGSEHVWLVHGSDGLDEITTTGPTRAIELRDGAIRAFTIEPESLGFAKAKIEDLKGGEAMHNAAALRAVLYGEKTAYRDIAILNAAAGLVVAGKAADLKDGVALAAGAIDSGAATRTLDKLVAVSNA